VGVAVLQEDFNWYGGPMMEQKQKLNHICSHFSKQIHTVFDDIVSVILYGSAATGEYDPKKSDVNFLVVLGNSGIQRLDKVHHFVKDWKKHKISLPLFVTQTYIQNSLDSFPIEFLNMQSAYQLIDGEDVLKDLKVSKKDLRLQCERELKGKLLQLRQGFIHTRGSRKSLQFLISTSIVTFVSIFKALLYLKDLPVPEKKVDVLLKACDAFDDIDRNLFEMLLRIRQGEVKRSKSELELILQQYIQSIAKLSETVDKM